MVARALSIVSLTFLVSAPLAAQTSRHVLKGDSVAIYNLVGELRVEAGTGSDVVVELQRGGADAAKLDVQSGPLRGRETLRVIYPDDVIVMPDREGLGRGWNTTLRVRDDGTFGEEHGRHERGSWFREGREVRITGRSRDGLEAYADLRVSVPAGKNVALYLGVGKAFVSNVDGTIRVNVASADVSADRTKGALKIETGSGNVDVRTATGDVSLNTGSGDVTASDIDGSRLYLETGSGNVTLTGGKAPTVHVETGSGDVEATATSGADLSFETGSGNVNVALVTTFSSLRVNTGSGDVTLKVPPALGAEVDIDTGSGDIDLGGLTLQVRRLAHDHVTGTMGDGKGRLSVETGSGDIEATATSGADLSFETGSGNVNVALVTTFQSLRVETGSGDVTLKVPPALGAEVDIDTGSGDIDLGGLTLQVRRLAHDHVTGTMGDGKGRLSVETGSGDVHLQKLF